VSFHEGELLVQERAGVLSDAQRTGQILRRAISPGARAFLAGRRFVVLTAATADDHVWVSVLTGAPGFLEPSEDGQRLLVSEAPRGDDPVAQALRPGASVGLVAIDFAARRRFRVNGTVVTAGAELLVDVGEAYGNCPKYIQAYRPAPDGPVLQGKARSSDLLDDDQRRWIQRAETFFLGTLHPEAGADASHRGGAPGFVRVTGPRELVWGDYSGNALFNSLGNAAVHQVAGLLFLDGKTGSTLQLSGKLSIDWSTESAAAIPGAERVIRFTVNRIVQIDGAIPLRWARGEPSPFNPPAR